MKRKILLLLGGLAVSFSAYAAYDAVSEMVDDGALTADPNLGRQNVNTRPSIIEETAASDVYFVRRDPKTNRPQSEMRFADWVKQGENRFDFTDPNVVLHMKDGQRVRILADEGTAYVREVDRQIEPRHGKLTGNVRIFFYRKPERGRSPEQNVVRIHVDDIEFDNEMLLLRTDGPVTLWSHEADVLGTGLLLRWNEDPGELDTLRIEKGQYLVAYTMPSDMANLGGSKASQNGEAEKAPASRPAKTADRKTPAAKKTPGDVRKKQASTAPAEREPLNKYVATFRQDVRVMSGEGVVTGIDKLSIIFEWDRSWQEDKDDTRPNRRPSNTASARRSREGNTQKTTPSAADVTETDGEDANATNQPVKIYWTGPLEIVPTGYVEDPSSKRFAVHAEGKRVDLKGQDYRAVCSRFSYLADGEKQVGLLEGEDDEPVRMIMAGGECAVAPVVTFDRAKSKVFLRGAGQMFRPANVPPEEVGLLVDLPLEEIEKADRIQWTKRVEATFGEKQVSADGKTETKAFLKDAVFHGGVVLGQKDDATFVRCDRLTVNMAQTDAGKTYASDANAEAMAPDRQVLAVQDGSRITANRLSLTFDPPEATDDTTDANATLRARPRSLVAAGKVRLEARRDSDADAKTDDEAKPIIATCDELRSDLVGRNATLRGAPAVIQQDANEIAGSKIYLERGKAGELLTVAGKGQMTLRTDRDLDGRPLATARLVKIFWSEGMNFNGSDDQAIFRGDVKLRSGMDQMDCRKMVVHFDREKSDAAEKTATPTGKDDSGRAVLDMGDSSFAKRRIRTVLAEKDVRLLSKRLDEQDRMLWRFALVTPRQLTFDANARTMQVDGKGTLAVEDYRQPEHRQKPTTDEQAYLVSPSQTVFDWVKSMSLSQKDLTVIMDGDVGVVHRSGKNVVLTKGLKVPFQMSSAPDGRKTELGCRWLTATFSQLPKSQKEASADANGQDPGGVFGFSGRLDRFVAKHGVTLRDGRARVEDCERLLFDRVEDLVRLDGYLPKEGQKPSNVYLRYEDRQAGLQQKSAPVIIWHPEKKIARAKDVTGIGSSGQ